MSLFSILFFFDFFIRSSRMFRYEPSNYKTKCANICVLVVNMRRPTNTTFVYMYLHMHIYVCRYVCNVMSTPLYLSSLVPADFTSKNQDQLQAQQLQKL